ncbi:MAG: prepilin-type N-terminal cleavage/methylation domain-containing protein [Pseudomonadota bacterium]
MPPRSDRPRLAQRGVTLVEMIVVIAVIAVVGAMVAVFLRTPIESYAAQDRRARLADAADTALRRMTREVRLALPNSVRVSSVGGVHYLEFLATRSGGRYRAEGGGDILDFVAPDTGFDVLGPAVSVQAGDRIAVYNLGIAGADAWAGDTLADYTGASGSVNAIAIAAKQFPLASPGQRFQVVEGAVSYACDPAAGTLTRYWGYAPAAAQPTAFAAGTAQALLATGVTACRITYQPGVTERSGLLALTLELGRDGENVRLYASAQVGNQP